MRSAFLQLYPALATLPQTSVPRPFQWLIHTERTCCSATSSAMPIAAPDAVRYEAEAVALTGADVWQGAASGGAYVGSLDELGKTLSFSVAVTDVAEYCLWVNYVNGSLRTAS